MLKLPSSLAWLIKRRGRIDGSIQKIEQYLDQHRRVFEKHQELTSELSFLRETLGSIDTTLRLHKLQIDPENIPAINGKNYLTEQFENYLTRNSLIQISPFESHLSELCMKVGRVKFFERCLTLSLRGMHLIDRVTLLWMLFQQTQVAQTWEMRSFLESKLDQDLDRLFHSYLAKQDPQEFYFLATKAMFNIRLVSKRPPSICWEKKRMGHFALWQTELSHGG